MYIYTSMLYLVGVIVVVIVLLVIFDTQLYNASQYIKKEVDPNEKLTVYDSSVPIADYIDNHRDFPYWTSSMKEMDLNDNLYSIGGYSGYDDLYNRDITYSNYDGRSVDTSSGREFNKEMNASYGGYPEFGWMDYIQDTTLDPSVQSNHREYVKDVSRFYTGAGFTNVADDNRDPFNMNFLGLRRPHHVEIGDDARQQQDVDTNVMKRNRRVLL